MPPEELPQEAESVSLSGAESGVWADEVPILRASSERPGCDAADVPGDCEGSSWGLRVRTEASGIKGCGLSRSESVESDNSQMRWVSPYVTSMRTRVERHRARGATAQGCREDRGE